MIALALAILAFDAGMVFGCWWATRDREETPAFVPAPPRTQVEDGPVLSDAESDLVWEQVMGATPWRVDW